MSEKTLEIRALPGYPEEIGRQLWMMEDVRRDLLQGLRNVTREELDTPLDGNVTTIGALLYHIADVETGWLHFDMFLRKKLDPEIEPWFAAPTRNETGEIWCPPGESPERHFERLAVVRRDFLDKLRTVDKEDWRRIRSLPGEYDVTPEWIVYHLIEHEAHHRGQIFRILGTLRRQEEK
ncbi:DinB family protein [Saccharibacillus alkalitolerans]|uniref:DinB family protein n=1 Tax=Saccharibacillus alkalitolerans TaxID=2705290 RepID=A0ABX0F9W8_9BACL|nr:DinB family protein [Saccharibacillus alkalitolerans]NGZ77737.1 DinB family protein [Saccharibacillus alkalitolerans]